LGARVGQPRAALRLPANMKTGPAQAPGPFAAPSDTIVPHQTNDRRRPAEPGAG